MGNLEKLFYWRGIGNEFINYRGDNVVVSQENRLRLLNAMDVTTESEEAISQHVFDLEIRPWQNCLAPLVLIDLGHKCEFEVNLEPELLGALFSYRILLEDGSEVSGEFVGQDHPEVGDYLYEQVRYSKRAIEIEPLPCGYHQIEVQLSGSAVSNQATSELIVVPATAYAPTWVDQGKRPWGIIVQLYTLRSHRNWGIGDFTDLKFLIKEAVKAGADMIGLNPLHALRSPVEHHCSPYSPSDRRFLNPLYIDPESEPDFVPDEGLNKVLRQLREPSKVDYGRVNEVKMSVFWAMYKVFLNSDLEPCTQRGQAFIDFVDLGAQPLQDFCFYQVVNEYSGTSIDQLTESEQEKIRLEHGGDIQFHAYLQWLANEQLENCQTYAKRQGMCVGLMRDLAVGADGGGAEVCCNLKLFCRDAAVGAPPDPLAEIGQNWGLPPMDPTVLKSTNFEHFVNLLRANMAHCGALRMDHAMGLMRLWWCPPGKTADFGAYVYYPFRELLGILKLESQRNQCMVIGEDMGIVPEGFREALMGANIFTNKMFYFEKQEGGCFTPPHEYFERSLSMLTNHDVPTIASWWVGSDLELRDRLNLFEEGVTFNDVWNARQHEKHRLLEWLLDLNLLNYEDVQRFLGEPMTHALASKVLHGVSHCASQLFVIQLEDLELLDSPVNVPGTSDQYANWQRKLEVPLEDLFSDQGVQSLMSDIRSERI